MTEEAREAALVAALDAMSWRTLEPDEMAAFVLGAVKQAEAAGVAEGIRQAREAVAGSIERSADYGPHYYPDDALNAIDAITRD